MRRMNKFLVYVDDPSVTLGVLDRIIEAARAGQARVTLAGVVEPVRWWAPDTSGTASQLEQAMASSLEGQLNEYVQLLDDAGLEVAVTIYRGDPTTELVRAVLRDGYDLLLKAPGPRRDRSGQGLGSIDRRLLRACPCPVAILRPLLADRTGRIVAAVDFDPEQPEKGAVNEVILDVAVNAALAGFRELYVLHVWHLFGESSLSTGFARISDEALRELLREEERLHREWLDSLVNDHMSKLGAETVRYLAPRVLLLKGSPREVIPQQVEELKPDLLVLGSVARTGVAGLLMGNTAEAILNEVNCSVATVKPPGFQPPIGI